MLLDLNLIERLLNGIEINGALHIGAHECEELLFYTLEDLKWDARKASH